MKTIHSSIGHIHQYEVQRYKEGNIPEILKMLKNNSLTRDQLTDLISIRYEAAHFFEDILRLIIKKIKEDVSLENTVQQKLLYSAEQNLKEELGEEEKYGGPHENGRKVLLTALGVDYEKWKGRLGTIENTLIPNVAPKKLIEEFKDVVNEGSIEAVSALWYYENRISLDGVVGDYYILLKAFEIKFPEFKKDTYQERDVLWHIASHAHHDEFHAQIAKDGLLSLVNTVDSVEKIERACEEMRKAIDTFWNDCRDVLSV